MKVEYINNATINYNNSITAINTYLGEMAKEDINCAYIIGDYIEKCRSIRSYNMQFDNVYPYEGIKDNCIYISKIVDYLSECVSNLYEIGYKEYLLQELLDDVLKNEKTILTVHSLLFFRKLIGQIGLILLRKNQGIEKVLSKVFL